MEKEGFPKSLNEMTVTEAYILYRYRNDMAARMLLNRIFDLGIDLVDEKEREEEDE